ncbi:MAG: hypothetical protein K6F82_00500 [Sphaerochaetaceae bacterium]|nr:hypothetical protein [Sphaerochaetaceae bacterium]
MKNKRILLYIQTILCILLFLILTVSALSIYLQGMESRETDPLCAIYTPEKVLGALKIALPVFILSAVVLVVSLVWGVKDEKPYKGKERVKQAPESDFRVLRIIVLVLSVAFIVIGLCGGGVNSVLNKAVKICTECIGLG